MASKEQRYILGSMKITMNVLITLVATGTLLLFSFFVIDGIDFSRVHTVGFWVRRVFTSLGTFLILVSVSNVTEESRKRKTQAYGDRLKSLDTFYLYVNEGALTERMEFYILQKNIKAKYVAFVKKYKKKLLRCKVDEKHKEKRDAIEQKLLMSPDDVWASPEKIRFPQITYSLLISGASDVNAKESENDLHQHRADLFAKNMMWRLLIIVALGMYLPDIITSFQNFNVDQILPLCFRIAAILWAIYCGVCFGYIMLDRLLVVLKRKIKIFSEFEARTNNTALVGDEKYLLTYEKDGQVEKIKAKYGVAQPVAEQPKAESKVEQVIEEKPTPPQNALQQVYAESFGAHKPITPGKAVASIIKLHVAKQINQPIEQATEA